MLQRGLSGLLGRSYLTPRSKEADSRSGNTFLLPQGAVGIMESLLEDSSGWSLSQAVSMTPGVMRSKPRWPVLRESLAQGAIVVPHPNNASATHFSGQSLSFPVSPSVLY